MSIVIIIALTMISMSLWFRGNYYRKLYMGYKAEDELKASMASYKIEPIQGQADKNI